MLRPVLVTPAATLPLSLDEAKQHCRVHHTDDDSRIAVLISAATSYLDGPAGILGRALIEQTWQQDYDSFSAANRIPIGDAREIVSVTYFDQDNASQALASAVYSLFSDDAGDYVALKPGQSWPSTYCRPDAVRITWKAGFGTGAGDVPAAIRQAMLLLIGNWNLYAEASLDFSATRLPFGVEALLEPFRRRGA